MKSLKSSNIYLIARAFGRRILNMRPLGMMFALAAFPVCGAIACAPGEWLQQGAGWQMCVPMPGMSGNASQPGNSEPVWEDRWGAIAVDDIDNGVGIGSASDMRRKGQAEKAALTACKKKGGTRCAIKLTYYSQCAVLVWRDHGFNATGAPTIEKATQIGMEKCNKAKDTNCEVYFSDCSPQSRSDRPYSPAR
ncbi:MULTISPECIES: DUF4189 domain-containing protein [unclassified Lysobacter]|uniref:DUF4189 domain-containing protein n=1 Tax=unclassified Lysobacter TaxID=2635362 RepID=UPI001BE7268D|nr:MULTISPECIES: DUF4189 domain-containing protein [unclassified Lysobacter]MBT2746929.1 DUF4189 domain-containing protein [Lysobacter sp. ISL-42]MBT2750610.1 DUF4189 domain-containing protein [Lysobacter sp. ISL-50]MBT2776456.1 DUF4189 domain-containing protein [Lysobacter sp. ISL-54]MBT2780951.1 DUF4189 domain-containing protein [Lysobacter sp. ISL-52]